MSNEPCEVHEVSKSPDWGNWRDGRPTSPVARPAVARQKPGRRAGSVIAMSSAAIVSVYGVGYLRTQAADSRVNTPTDAGAGSVSLLSGNSGQPMGNEQSVRQPSVSGGVSSAQSESPPPIPTPPPTMTNATGAVSPTPGRSSQPAGSAPSLPQPSAASAPAPTQTQPSQQPNPTPTPTKAAAPPSSSPYRDGTFTGAGSSRHGSIQVRVVVSGGMIISADVTGCGTRYPCSKVTPLVSQVVARQSAPVNYVSGATDSSTAYIQAIKSALAQAAA
jgi:uncharacterized protein with FMN-binding domain